MYTSLYIPEKIDETRAEGLGLWNTDTIEYWNRYRHVYVMWKQWQILYRYPVPKHMFPVFWFMDIYMCLEGSSSFRCLSLNNFLYFLLIFILNLDSYDSAPHYSPFCIFLILFFSSFFLFFVTYGALLVHNSLFCKPHSNLHIVIFDFLKIKCIFFYIRGRFFPHRRAFVVFAETFIT